ncbi:hypothetical protein LMG33818_002113 [Halomonadaceae bacterium LMG 33818]|uniref:hypothetical protein n=1 Tax=Cernens ardua TaxID=3402176 RepID=UPI003EDC2120
MSDPVSQYEQSLYMDAMGLTLWTARYRLPNAEQTPACEWPEASRPAQVSPSQRLKALRQDADSSSETVSGESPTRSAAVPPVSTGGETVPPVERVSPQPDASDANTISDTIPFTAQVHDRDVVPDSTSNLQATSSETASRTAATTPSTLQDSLAFSFHAITLGNRWWVLSSQQAFDTQSLALLSNILMAMESDDRSPTHSVDFKWPMIEGFKVEDPQAEAEDGVLAFVAGQQEQQGKPQMILLLADDADENAQVLSRVLGIDSGTSTLLELPVIQGAALPTLLSRPSAKRALWHALVSYVSAGVSKQKDA